MPSAIDKVILTDLTALKAKYGDAGASKINKSVDALIAADKQRGLTSCLIAVDDAAAMKKLAATAVVKAADPKQNKVAVDGIYKALAPDYLLILGSVDVIPHQDLKNPVYDPSPSGDPDKIAFGDLPYACEAPYSQKPQDFLGPTRVVGRLPDLTGGADPAYLVGLLQTAASYKTQGPTGYDRSFGISAQIWKKSTALSLGNIFGTATDLKTIPPGNKKWPAASLRRMAHFINCHGADTSSQFYGQPASGKEVYPVALDAAYVNGKVADGTVAAAECCYGGQLYDPSLLKGQQGILNTYLANKAYGFFASTTIAYGPEDSNAQADLICQYFILSVLGGASLGRAALEARQKFVQTASPPDPSDIKTLSQFNLYGDPSITPIKMPSPSLSIAKPKSAKSMVAFAGERAERSDRRRLLFRIGLNLANTEAQAYFTARKATRSVQAALLKKAGELGIKPTKTLSFDIRHPAGSMKTMPKTLGAKLIAPTRFHVIFGDTGKKDRASSAPVVRIVGLIGKEVDGQVVSVRKIASR